MNLSNRIVLLFSLLLSFTYNAMSQPSNKTLTNSYKLHGNFDSNKTAFFKKSIEAADFEQYRLLDANIILRFKNGFELELISAKQLAIKGNYIGFNPTNYQERKTFPLDFKYPIFEIASSGWITAEVQTVIKK